MSAQVIEELKRELSRLIPLCVTDVEEPERDGGAFWIDVRLGEKRLTLEYRPGLGFGLFHAEAGFGEGPAEIYRTADLAARRVAQLMAAKEGEEATLGLKEIRELYGHSQVDLAQKAGVNQPAISRLEKRGEVKLGTLAATIKALGGRLEVRAHFSDANVALTLPTGEE